MTWIASFDVNVTKNVHFTVDFLAYHWGGLLMIGSVVYDHTVYPTIIEVT